MKFRHEYKHRISYGDELLLQRRLGALLSHDPYAGEDGTYLVHSLYFDNYRDKALREKLDGVDRREKFRIRYYGDDTSFLRLEKKSKVNGFCSKEQVRISREECQKILDGEIDFLREKDSNLCRELYAKMHYELLRPKCIVVYRRECFVHKVGNVRVTLDTSVSGSYRVGEFLNPSASLTHTFHPGILEVKWDECLPQLIKDAVGMNGRKTAAFSKYAAVRI